MNDRNVSHESLGAGLPDIKEVSGTRQSQDINTEKNSKKLTGSFNAGLKDLKMAIKQNQNSNSQNNANGKH